MITDFSGLRKFIAPEIIFGRGSRKLVGSYCKSYHSKKVLLVTDKGVKHQNWFKDILASLEEEHIDYALFHDFSPNPRAFEVMSGVEIFQREQCDLIVAVGGGSPMDGAKGIGIVATNGGHILEFQGVNMIKNPLPPMIFVPSTAGTSADVSQFAIINDNENRVKVSIISKIVIPDVSLVDSETTVSMNSYLTACTGMDALVHAIEAYVSIAHSPLTDTHALEAIRVLAANLRHVIATPENLDFRDKVMFGSLEAGLAFSNAILGAVHAMSHSLGGMLDLPHGECNSLLLEHVINYNYPAVPERFAAIARACGLPTDGLTESETRMFLFSYIQDLKTHLGITKTLKDCGVSVSDIPLLAKKAHRDSCLITNPRKSETRDLETIYEEAY